MTLRALSDVERVFLARMIEAGFDGYASRGPALVRRARDFARMGARSYGSWTVREFRGPLGRGCYIERGHGWRWFDNLTMSEAAAVLEEEAANRHG